MSIKPPFMVILAFVALVGCIGDKSESVDDTGTPQDTGKPEDTGTSPCEELAWYADADADGYGDLAQQLLACEQPDGAVAEVGDCDDTRADIHPGAGEACDALDTDEDCDGLADDADMDIDPGALVTWYRDYDADGYGDGTGATLAQCEAPEGYASELGDCDNTDSGRSPGAPERCDDDDTDEDCDDLADDADPSVDASTWSIWYSDGDGDGHGDAARSIESCDPFDGFVGVSDDCDDAAAGVNPDAAEACDSADLDDDCDGLADDEDTDPEGTSTWYADADGDGWGDEGTTLDRCDQPGRYVSNAEDCDDSASGISPDAVEACDSANVDEDCDGLADDADTDATGERTWYADADGDSWGDEGTTIDRCDQPAGHVADAGDCDDSASDVSPDAVEACDGGDVDEDCNGLIDDEDSPLTGTLSWYPDADEDGYGDTVGLRWACQVPAGHVATASDCDDADPLVHPSASEVCDAADTDEDCDGSADDDDSSVSGESTWYRDGDADGYGNAGVTRDLCAQPSGYVADSSDCDDTSASVSPGAAEVCDTADTDEDCDALADDDDPSASGKSTWYADEDGDGYGWVGSATQACGPSAGVVSNAEDCDESDATVNPDNTEVCNEIDDDCDGAVDDEDASISGSTWYEDADGDGYGDASSTLSACAQPAGYEDDADDCYDSDADLNPDGTEIYGDEVDEDCDGETSPSITCSGVSVPGDYSTLGEAVSALSAGGTICLDAGSYVDDIPSTLSENIVIIGPSAETTTIVGDLYFTGKDISVWLRGVTVQGSITVSDPSESYGITVYLMDMKVMSSSHGVSVLRDSGGDADLSLHRVEIDAGASSIGVYVVDSDGYRSDRMSIRISNSYIHDSQYCMVGTFIEPVSDASVSITYNTFDNCTNGVSLTNHTEDLVATVQNNIFYSMSGYALVENLDSSGTLMGGYNLFYDNGVDYYGTSASTGDLTGDPDLDFSYTPPRPGEASVAREAADPGASAGEVDFWNLSRGTAPYDIGAVEEED